MLAPKTPAPIMRTEAGDGGFGVLIVSLGVVDSGGRREGLALVAACFEG